MADAFLATLKEFERVILEIGDTRTKLEALEKSGDQLRKQLKSLRGGSQVSGGTASSDGEVGPTQAITEIVNIVRELGGSARLADIAKAAGLGVKVAATRIQRANKAGLLVRAGHGQYQLPAGQLQALATGDSRVSESTDAASAENQQNA